MEKPHKELIVEWRSHPVTKYYHARLQQDLEDLKVAWAEGVYTNEDSHGTLQLNSSAVGSAQALQAMIQEIEDMEFNDA